MYNNDDQREMYDFEHRNDAAIAASERNQNSSAHENWYDRDLRERQEELNGRASDYERGLWESGYSATEAHEMRRRRFGSF